MQQGTAAGQELFARRREKREEARRRLMELRGLIRKGLEQLVRAMQLLRDAEERGTTPNDLLRRLIELADEAELIAAQLEAGSSAEEHLSLSDLLSQGQIAINRAASSAREGEPATESAQIVEDLKRLIEKYKTTARPSLEPMYVGPLFRVNWRQLLPSNRR